MKIFKFAACMIALAGGMAQAATLTATLPTTLLVPGVEVSAVSAAVFTASLDYFSLYATGLGGR